jgi:hypothetical protein
MRQTVRLDRKLLRSLMPVALGFGILCSPASATVSGGSRSGLPWASGASGGLDELEALRGRRLDIRTAFFGVDDWAHMAKSASALRRTIAAGGQLVIALGMLPRSHAEQHQQCADGAFDALIRAVAEGIVRKGGAGAVIRLGWEANRVRGFPWAVTGDGTAYKACFRRWVAILRAVPGQSFTIDWNMAQAGTFPYHVERMYPGDDVVDVIGVQQYDRCNPVLDEAAWQAAYQRRRAGTGSPIGLGAWLDFALSKGKRLSVPEWGIGGPNDICRTPGIDNPFFIRKMHAFFAANAASIAYEAYFNGHGAWDGAGNPSDHQGSHKLAPAHYNPQSAATYRALWSTAVTQPPPPPPAAAVLSILAANYYGFSALCDATGAMGGACDGRSSCSVRASDDLCGDPQPTVLKRLDVVYACRGERRWVDVAEGTIVDLRCQ